MEDKKSKLSISVANMANKESKRAISRPSMGHGERHSLGQSDRHSMIGGRRSSRVSSRRNTFGFGSIPAIRPEHMMSLHKMEFRRPNKIFLNTYQLDPKRPFHVAHAKALIDGILDELFDRHIYNLQESPLLAGRISSEVIRRAKSEQFDRIRLIAVTSLGQRRMQSYNNAVTFLWDHERDSYVNVTRELHTVFVQVTLFGVYLD